jgi:hypothetical protein
MSEKGRQVSDAEKAEAKQRYNNTKRRPGFIPARKHHQ